MDAEQEQHANGFIDIPIPVQVCFTPLNSPNFKAEWSETRPKALL